MPNVMVALLPNIGGALHVQPIDMPIVKYRDILSLAVQKRLNRWRCRLGR